MQVLHDPEPAALVEVEIERLADHRFAGDQVHGVALAHDEPASRLFRGQWGTLPSKVLAAGFERAHEWLQFRRIRGRGRCVRSWSCPWNGC